MKSHLLAFTILPNIFLIDSNTNLLNVFNNLTNPYCRIHCANGELHSACPCNRASTYCKPLFSNRNSRMRTLVLNQHNEIRNRIALGMETRGNMSGITAANMNILNYDLELETIAICHTRQCVSSLDRCILKIHYLNKELEESNVISEEVTSDKLDIVRGLILKWDNQFKYAGGNFPQIVDSYVEQDQVIDFVKIIWANTKFVGCAASENVESTNYALLTCIYYPGGNIVGEPIFKKGLPATNCLKDDLPNKKYEGLCGELKNIPKDPARLPFDGKWYLYGLAVYIFIIMIQLCILLYFCTELIKARWRHLFQVQHAQED